MTNRQPHGYIGKQCPGVNIHEESSLDKKEAQELGINASQISSHTHIGSGRGCGRKT